MIPMMITLQISYSSSNISKMTYMLFLILVLPATVLSDQCTCESVEATTHDKSQALKFRLLAIVSVLISGAVGVSLPLLGRKFSALRPENDEFFLIKAFAAGVILGTGFIHILPDAFENLTSACLEESPWRNFPFSGFIAMMSAIGTLIVDSLATGCYKSKHFKSTNQPVIMDEEKENGHAGHLHVHTHATHGHAHGSAIEVVAEDLNMAELIRIRVVSQVLELGIVVHSVIIGVTFGASQSLHTIKPLLAALSFHQFFEGMGLGGCISQARFQSLSTLLMATFFSLTTPVGIAIGIGISSVYRESTQISLIIEGCFNSASAGILIYMALVDLLATDFMNSRMQSNVKLQLGASLSLLLGAGCMSVLAKWA